MSAGQDLGASGAVPRRSRAAAVVDLDTTSLLFNADRRELHELNEPARAIWGEIDGYTPTSAIAARLANRFGADFGAVVADVATVIERLESLAAIEGERVAVAQPRAAVPNGAVCLSAVDATLALTGSHSEVVRTTLHLLETLRIEARPTVDAVIRADRIGSGCRISVGREVFDVAGADAAVERVLGEVNLIAAKGSPASVRFHAAGVVLGGRTVLLPAPSGSGKSTLACGLVRRGAGYLSDEMIGVAAGSLAVPYPKAITLDAAAAALFRELVTVRAGGEVHAPTPRAAHFGPVELVVSPCYEPGRAEPALQQLDQVAAVRLLLENSMDFAGTGGAGFEIIGNLCRTAEVWRVAYGSLDDACAAVEALARTR